MKFDTKKFPWSYVSSAKFEENRFIFRYSSHIYDRSDLQFMGCRSCIFHRIVTKFNIYNVFDVFDLLIFQKTGSNPVHNLLKPGSKSGS